MPKESGRPVVTAEELAGQVRGEMIPLGRHFSYFSVVPMAEEDLKQYGEEPLAALPPVVCSQLPRTELVFVPYLEKGNGQAGDKVRFEPPPSSRQIYVSRVPGPDGVTLLFAIKDEEVADYHFTLYNALAGLIADAAGNDVMEPYLQRLREELAAEVHGEVDEASWRLKQVLIRRPTNIRRESKHFRDYARQSLEDTLTLYLHGICCDIDVETGPRQLPSRYLRKRLELLMQLFPPPEGYVVLPDQTKRR